MIIFDEYESGVRTYCRNFPVIFSKSKDSILYTEDGEEYLDFFAGAGALNYGHNNKFIKQKIIDYLQEDGIVHALDMSTEAKRYFIKTFQQEILKPRNLDYKIMFCGATGTNAVEAAVKLARKVKKRSTVFAFTGSFHGMSLGSLSLTSNKFARNGAGIPLHDVVFMPFPSGFNEKFDTIEYLENVIRDDHSGVDLPAAIIVETIQAEGGIYIADDTWIHRLYQICRKYDILLICDEIQVGCCRSGNYFSFERAGIIPDIVLLSKSISGLGLPMSIAVYKIELDIWKPGEHNGTFRGNQLAFVGAAAALDYINTFHVYEQVRKKEKIITEFIVQNILPLHDDIKHRGIGMIHGLDFSKLSEENMCKDVMRKCFENKLIIESAGRNGSVLKLLPPLNIEEEQLLRGLNIIQSAIGNCL